MKKRIVGLDYGQVRIGVALSDERKIIASSLTTFRAHKQKKETVKALLAELLEHSRQNGYEIEEIVIGLPLMMSGVKGSQANEVLEFVRLLQEETSIPINTWDERLTSAEAEKMMKEGGMNRKQRSKAVDQVAAVIILQNYLTVKYPDGRSPHHIV